MNRPVLLLIAALVCLAAANTSTYVFVFRDHTTADERDNFKALVHAEGSEILNHYDFGPEENAFRGFAAKVSDRFVAAAQSHPLIEIVQEEQIFTIQQCNAQQQATWGLDRINSHDRFLDGIYTYDANQVEVDAYIIDTGIDINHSDFGGRAVWGATFTASLGDSSDDDCNGHGTHVAGTVGSQTYGVSKTARLIAVKVLNCAGSGTNAGIIAGLNWIAQNRNPQKKAVINMSLGGGADAALDKAVNKMVDVTGITVVVAAGNSNLDASKFSPARAASVITVGATEFISGELEAPNIDRRSSFSNYGSYVDIWAPGTDITSTWIGESDTDTKTISGTSMASPHIAGVVAVFLANDPSLTTVGVKQRIYQAAQTNSNYPIDLNCGAAPSSGCSSLENANKLIFVDCVSAGIE